MPTRVALQPRAYSSTSLTDEAASGNRRTCHQSYLPTFAMSLSAGHSSFGVREVDAVNACERHNELGVRSRSKWVCHVAGSQDGGEEAVRGHHEPSP